MREASSSIKAKYLSIYHFYSQFGELLDNITARTGSYSSIISYNRRPKAKQLSFLSTHLIRFISSVCVWERESVCAVKTIRPQDSRSTKDESERNKSLVIKSYSFFFPNRYSKAPAVLSHNAALRPMQILPINFRLAEWTRRIQPEVNV